MSQSSHDCLICLSYAKKRRSQIDNYYCECDYYIHQSCYDRWRETSGTDRLCIICDVHERPQIQIIQYGAEVVRVDNNDIEPDHIRQRCHGICEECIIICIVVLLLFLYLIRQIVYERNLRVFLF